MATGISLEMLFSGGHSMVVVFTGVVPYLNYSIILMWLAEVGFTVTIT